MSDQWYYRQGDEVFGPVSLPEVRRMLDASVLGPTDLVRAQHDSRWQSVSNALFRYTHDADPEPARASASEPEMSSEAKSGVDPADAPDLEDRTSDRPIARHDTTGSTGEMPEHLLAELLSQATDASATREPKTEPSRPRDARENGRQRRHEPRPVGADDEIDPLGPPLTVSPPDLEQALASKRSVAAVGTLPHRPSAGLKSADGDLSQPPRPLMPTATTQTRRKRRRGSEFIMPDGRLLAAAGIVVLLALAIYLPALFAKSTAAYVEQLFAIRQEFHALRARGATEAEWTEFSKRSEAELAAFSEELTATAGAGDSDARARQALLYAARDFFPVMLREARTQPDEIEEQFEFQLSEAVRLSGMEPPAGFEMRDSAAAVHADHHHFEGAGNGTEADRHSDHDHAGHTSQ